LHAAGYDGTIRAGALESQAQADGMDDRCNVLTLHFA
jgi:hypothetical protein